MKITKKDIESLVDVIKDITKDNNLVTNYAPHYGGWRLCRKGEGGSLWGSFNKSSDCERMTTKVFYQYLQGLIGGLTYNPNNVER
jgi:hypothetical protein